jgi:hypothetical protein
MNRRQSLYRRQNVRHISPMLAIGVVLVVITFGITRSILANEVLILCTYLVGVAAAAIAWYGSFRWKQALWTIGLLLVAFSMAAMFLTAQYWLAIGAFFLLLAIIIYPTVRKQTHEEVLRRRLRD